METELYFFYGSQEIMKTAMYLSSIFSSGPTREIMEFLFGDRRTLAFARHLRLHQPGRDGCLKMLENALSRRNGFIGGFPEVVDDQTEDWIFVVQEEGIFFQAETCSVCGEYKSSNTMHEKGFSINIICECK